MPFFSITSFFVLLILYWVKSFFCTRDFSFSSTTHGWRFDVTQSQWPVTYTHSRTVYHKRQANMNTYLHKSCTILQNAFYKLLGPHVAPLDPVLASKGRKEEDGKVIAAYSGAVTHEVLLSVYRKAACWYLLRSESTTASPRIALKVAVPHRIALAKSAPSRLTTVTFAAATSDLSTNYG
ncbi:hypothetical protein SVAN01_04917 [Stagonosporopsis vannaccii]|nr:hypothetical protein SVAN01_04917 [Stagonosporopsis vannaccii]